MSTNKTNSVNLSTLPTDQTKVETTPQETTPPKSLVPKIKAYQYKPLTKEECLERNLPSTDKAKPRLGVSEDHECVWAYPNFNLTDHSILRGFCKKHKLPMDELTSMVVMQWFEDNREAISADAAAYIAAAHTEESIQKKIESLARQTAEANKLLASLKKG